MKTRRKRSSGTDDARFFFDEAEANRAVAFIETLCCFDNGEPFVLQPWQKDFVRKLFGWKRRSDGFRRYRIVFLATPKGNGKTPLMAAVGAFLLFTVAGASIYSAAADRDQASLCLTDAKNFVNVSPDLRERAEILRGSIVVPARGSFWRSLSSQARSKHGIRPLAVLFDEVHTQQNRELWDTLYTGRLKNPNSLIFAATTAGFDTKSICYEIYQHACQVRDGAVEDPEFLPVIYEAAHDDDWRDPKIWAKANPNLGVTVREEDLATECRKAIEQPAIQNRFRRLHLNQWTEQEVRAIDMNAWREKCGGPLDMARLSGRPCWVGIDLSTKLDVTCAAFLFPQDDGTFDLVVHSWIPEENMPLRIRRDRVPFDAWVRDGWVEATPGNVIDYGFIRKRLNELREVYDVQEVAFDPWNAQQISVQLAEDGFEVIEFPQQPSRLNDPTQMLIALIGAGKIHHGDNPVMTWMASNLVTKENAGGLIYPVKGRRGSPDRIDGLVATIMALGRSSTQEAAVPHISSLG